MLAYLTIFVCSLAGLFGAPVWTISLATIGLASISYARHFQLYERGSTLGWARLVDLTVFSSLFNALATCSVAYAAGVLFRVLSPS
jgi:hypothetical protein